MSDVPEEAGVAAGPTTDEQRGTAMSERLARYETRVHASNRHAGLGVPVTVYAANRRDAAERAIAIGWNGHARDARVTVIRVDDTSPERGNPSE